MTPQSRREYFCVELIHDHVVDVLVYLIGSTDNPQHAYNTSTLAVVPLRAVIYLYRALGPQWNLISVLALSERKNYFQQSVIIYKRITS